MPEIVLHRMATVDNVPVKQGVSFRLCGRPCSQQMDFSCLALSNTGR